MLGIQTHMIEPSPDDVPDLEEFDPNMDTTWRRVRIRFDRYVHPTYATYATYATLPNGMNWIDSGDSQTMFPHCTNCGINGDNHGMQHAMRCIYDRHDIIHLLRHRSITISLVTLPRAPIQMADRIMRQDPVLSSPGRETFAVEQPSKFAQSLRKIYPRNKYTRKSNQIPKYQTREPLRGRNHGKYQRHR